MKEFYSILWQEKYIKDLCIVVKDKYDPKNNDTNEKIYIGLENMMTNKGIISKNNSLKIKSVKTKFEKYDLLYGRLRPYLNKHDVVTFDGICSTDILVFRFKNKITAKYINYYFDTVDFIKYVVKNSNGINLPRVSAKEIGLYKIKLPPINEQQRIVNIIESLFAKLDRAKELIENTLAQFEQNKMAILHKAFTGELTAKWRKENNIDLSSWEKIKLGKVLLPMQTKKPTGQFFRYIDIDAIDNKRQIVKAPKLILTEKAPSRASRGVETGNILFSMVRPYLKNIAQIDSDLSDCIASTGFYVCRCKPELNSRFLYYLFIFDKTIDYLMQFMKGDNSPSIRKDDLLNMKIDLPTIEEQQEIVNILDKLLAKYNKIKNLEQQLEKIELLKKAILAKVFRCELGINNHDEESAENLLKEILAKK